MKCKICNGDLIMQNDGEFVVCENCGVKYPISMLTAYGNGLEDDKQVRSFSFPRMPAEQHAGSLDGIVSNSSYKPIHNVIDNWSTSIGWSIAGAICVPLIIAIIGLITCFLANITNSYIPIFVWEIIYFSFLIVYVTVFYPSFFSDKPKIKSTKIINFLNLGIGGFIFGPIWNHNLTTRKRGISYIVFACFSAISIILVIVGIVFACLSGSLGYSTDDYTSKNVSPTFAEETIAHFEAYPDTDTFDTFPNYSNIYHDKAFALKLKANNPEELMPRIKHLLQYAGYDANFIEALSTAVYKDLSSDTFKTYAEGDSLDNPYKLSTGREVENRLSRNPTTSAYIFTLSFDGRQFEGDN